MEKENNFIYDNFLDKLLNALKIYTKYRSKLISFEKVKEAFEIIDIKIDENTDYISLNDILPRLYNYSLEAFLKSKNSLSLTLENEKNKLVENITCSCNDNCLNPDFIELLRAVRPRINNINKLLIDNYNLYMHNTLKGQINDVEVLIKEAILQDEVDYINLKTLLERKYELEQEDFELNLNNVNYTKLFIKRKKEIDNNVNTLKNMVINSDKQNKDDLLIFIDEIESKNKMKFLESKKQFEENQIDDFEDINYKCRKLDINKIEFRLENCIDLAKKNNYKIDNFIKLKKQFNKTINYNSERVKELYNSMRIYEDSIKESFIHYINKKYSKKRDEEKKRLYNLEKKYIEDITDFINKLEKEEKILKKHIFNKDAIEEKNYIKDTIINELILNKRNLNKNIINRLNLNLDKLFIKEQKSFYNRLEQAKTISDQVKIINDRENQITAYKEIDYSKLYKKYCAKFNVMPNTNLQYKLKTIFDNKIKELINKYNLDKQNSNFKSLSSFDKLKDSIKYIENDTKLKSKIDEIKYIIDNMDEATYRNYNDDLLKYLNENNKDKNKVYYFIDYYKDRNNIQKNKPIKKRNKVIKATKNIGMWIKNNKKKAIVGGLAFLIGTPILMQALMVTNSNLYNLIAENKFTSDSKAICNILHNINIVLAKISTLGSAKFESVTGFWKLNNMNLYGYYGNLGAYLIQLLSRLSVGGLGIYEFKRQIIDKAKLTINKVKLKKYKIEEVKYNLSDYEEFKAIYIKNINKNKDIMLREILKFMINHNIKSLSGLKEFIKYFSNNNNKDFDFINNLKIKDFQEKNVKSYILN